MRDVFRIRLKSIDFLVTHLSMFLFSLFRILRLVCPIVVGVSAVSLLCVVRRRIQLEKVIRETTGV